MKLKGEEDILNRTEFAQRSRGLELADVGSAFASFAATSHPYAFCSIDWLAQRIVFSWG
jgi:hypothetical protein